MAKSKKRRGKVHKHVHNITHNRSVFSPGKAGRLDQYIVANIITGLAIGAGSALATILIKSLLKYIDTATNVLPYEMKTELYSEKVASQKASAGGHHNHHH